MMTSSTSLNAVRTALRESADKSDAEFLRRYFKTAPGQYGEGDRFIGVRVPEIRRVARRFHNLPLSGTLVLLKSEIHEERFLALVILTEKFRRGTPDEQSEIYREYLGHTRFINNWDLVDTSADRIVGAYLRDRSRRPLYGLARSELLWERRIAVMATFHFIKNGEFAETLKIAGMLLADREDLIHKAAGWMLREVGKRDRNVEESFLREHYRRMPRTMLRYAIEKFPENLRQQYLRGTI
jgi:3-methyladenine DNA glycosylase AlkD